LIELLKRDYAKVVMVFHATRKEAINASSKGETYIDVIKDRNLSAVIRQTAMQSKEVQDVAHWLHEVKSVNISEMLPQLKRSTQNA
jgi:hypothetical protein